MIRKRIIKTVFMEEVIDPTQKCNNQRKRAREMAKTRKKEQSKRKKLFKNPVKQVANQQIRKSTQQFNLQTKQADIHKLDIKNSFLYKLSNYTNITSLLYKNHVTIDSNCLSYQLIGGKWVFNLNYTILQTKNDDKIHQLTLPGHTKLICYEPDYTGLDNLPFKPQEFEGFRGSSPYILHNNEYIKKYSIGMGI